MLVHSEVKDKLVKELKSTLQKFYFDDASISYDYGKIVNENRYDKLLGYLKKEKYYMVETTIGRVIYRAFSCG